MISNGTLTYACQLQLVAPNFFILKGLNVTVLAKTRLVRTKTEFNFITTVYRHTQYLSIPSVSSVKCNLVYFSEGHFADPPNSWLEQWHPWRAPIGQWGPGFAPTGYLAY